MSLWRHAFGHDIFISYARDDATAYANALHDALQTHGFKCFLDREAFTVGPQFRERLKREVQRSAVFVLICSPKALISPHVAFEVRAFADTGRDIILVKIPEATDPLPWREVVLGDPAWISEEAGCLGRGRPAAHSVREIEKHFSVTRQSTKRLRLLTAVALVLCGLLALSVYYGLGFRSERDRANKSADEAAQSAAEAKRQQAFAEERQRFAEKEEARADEAAAEAKKQQAAAESEKRIAESQRARAQQEERMAVARLLVLRAQNLVPSFGSANGDLAQLLIAEALAHFRSEETDTAFRSITQLRPIPVEPLRLSVNGDARSSDGKWRAEAAQDGIVRLTDNATGQLLQRWPRAVTRLSFSPDSELLFGVGADAVTVWEMHTRRELTRIPRAVKELYFAPNNRWLLAAGADVVTVWDMRARVDVASMPERNVAHVAFSENAHFAGVLTPRTISVWNLEDRRSEWSQPLSEDTQDIAGMVVANNGRMAAVATTYTTGPRDREGLPKSGIVRYEPGVAAASVWECEDCSIEPLRLVNDTTLLVRKDDHELRDLSDEVVWSMTVGIELRSGEETDGSDGVDPSRNDDEHPPGYGQPLPVRPYNQRLVALSPDRTLAAAGGMGVARVCGTTPKAACKVLALAENAEWPAFSADGQELMAVAADFVLRTWHVATGQVLHEARVDAPVQYVAYAPKARRVAILTNGGSVLVYADNGRAELGRIMADVSNAHVALSPDGRHLAIVDRSSAVRLWDVGRTISPRRFPVPGPFVAVAFGTDGTLALAKADRTIEIRNVDTGLRLLALRADIPMQFLATTADGQLVAASNGDKDIIVWETATGRIVARLPSGGAVNFSPDGRSIIWGSVYTSIATDVMLDRVCATVRRRLSATDWTTYVGSENYAPVCK